MGLEQLTIESMHDVMSIRQAAEALGVSYHRAYMLVRLGRLAPLPSSAACTTPARMSGNLAGCALPASEPGLAPPWPAPPTLAASPLWNLP